jgi:RND family efflux transporter MFP subunit
LAELKAAKNLGVSLWADPKITLRGELRELSPAADPATRTYAARIRINNPPPEVRLGMTARVALDGAVERALLVPLSAVIDVGQGPLVRVVKDGKIATRPVKVARFREDGVELSGGLEAGEQVIISGAGKLVDGQEVQARAATTPDRQR